MKPAAWLTDALRSADRLGIAEQYFAFAATRTSALLALERRDLAAAARINESILGHQAMGRPFFDYLAQLDRARIWAAGGDLDQALSSLPAARAALRSEDPFVLAEADELDARFHLALGDRSGAATVAERLPDDRRHVMRTLIAIASEDPRSAANGLKEAPVVGATIRSDLELRLLRASTALAERSSRSAQLVREALRPGPEVRLPPDGARDGSVTDGTPHLGVGQLPRRRLCKRAGERRPGGSKAQSGPSRRWRPGRAADRG